MAPIPDPSPPISPHPSKSSPEAQRRLLEEARARNRAFPTLNRMATGVALYGLYAATYSIFYVVQTRNWFGLTSGFLMLLWSVSLGSQLRQRVKWAWWLTLVLAGFLVLRFALSLLVQCLLAFGLARPTPHIFPLQPLVNAFHLVGLVLAANVLFFGLARATRTLFFAPANTQAT